MRRQDPITVAASVGGLAESIAALGTDAEVLSQQMSGGGDITVSSPVEAARILPPTAPHLPLDGSFFVYASL